MNVTIKDNISLDDYGGFLISKGNNLYFEDFFLIGNTAVKSGAGMHLR